ncbi:MAG: protease SohB [Pseudomonadales bacterium]|nr:protease SohB [Pseudomonadales bacterium]
MEFLYSYGLFLAKTLTLVLALVFIVIVVAANAMRGQHKSEGNITVTKLNDEFDRIKDDLRHEILDEDTLKLDDKAERQQEKAERKARKKALEAGEDDSKKRIFVLSFDGDTRASAVEELRHCISGILSVARPECDEVLLKLESPGGMVHTYGFAASQLTRLRSAKLRLTIAVDLVAASGGYMMAAVADHLVAAPFAYVGSIGVLVQLPNVHRLLRDNKIDYEMITAGEYKRTLTTFGENTEKDRLKVQEEVDEMHALFKAFIAQYRPQVDLASVATGEVWTGQQALARGLIDALDISDEWIRSRLDDSDIYAVNWEYKKKFGERLSSLFEGALARAFDKVTFSWLHRADKEKFFS